MKPRRSSRQQVRSGSPKGGSYPAAATADPSISSEAGLASHDSDAEDADWAAAEALPRTRRRVAGRAAKPAAAVNSDTQQGPQGAEDPSTAADSDLQDPLAAAAAAAVTTAVSGHPARGAKRKRAQGSKPRKHSTAQARRGPPRAAEPAGPLAADSDSDDAADAAKQPGSSRHHKQQHQGSVGGLQLSSLAEVQQQLRSSPEWQQQWQLQSRGLACVQGSYRGQPVWLLQDAAYALQQHNKSTAGAAARRSSSPGTDADLPADLAAEAGAGPASGQQQQQQRDFMFAYYRSQTRTWRAAVALPRVVTRLLGLGANSKLVPISNRYRTAADAARAADLAQLALLGPWKGMKLNFPLWQYRQQDQQPRQGLELSKFISWLKAQATAATPFAGCSFAAPAAAAAGGGAGRGEHSKTNLRHAGRYKCGMCTGCMLKRGCVVAGWRDEEARAALFADDPTSTIIPYTAAAAGSIGTGAAAAAAAGRAAQVAALRAEQLLQRQHRTELRLVNPEAARLVSPAQAAAAAVVAAAPRIAAAAAAEAAAADNRAQRRALYKARSVPQPQQLEQAEEDEDSQQQRAGDEEVDEAALISSLLDGATWQPAAPAASQFHASAAAAARLSAAVSGPQAGVFLSRYAALPQLPSASDAVPRQLPTPRPGVQQQLQQQLAGTTAAAQAGLSSMLLNPAPPTGAGCRACLSLQHGARVLKGTKCPIHKLQQQSVPAALQSEAPTAASQGPADPMQQQQQQQQQQQAAADQGWMSFLGPGGVELVGALRDLADRVLAPEVNRIREGLGARLRMRRMRERLQQQQQQQQRGSGHSAGDDADDAALAGGEAGGLSSSSDSDSAGAATGRKKGTAKGRADPSSNSDGDSSSSSSGDSRSSSDDSSDGSREGVGTVRGRGSLKRQVGALQGEAARAAKVARRAAAAAAAAGGGGGAAAGGGPAGAAGRGSGSGTCVNGHGVGGGGGVGDRLGLDPWSFVAAAVLLQEMSKHAAGL